MRYNAVAINIKRVIVIYLNKITHVEVRLLTQTLAATANLHTLLTPLRRPLSAVDTNGVALTRYFA